MAQRTAADKALYTARTEPELVEVPAGQFLTFSGHGAPEGSLFQQAVGALYAVAYGLKFRLKPSGQDFAVPPLEGLWWVDKGPDWQSVPREQWQWKLMIRMPSQVAEGLFRQVWEEVMAKKKAPEIGQVQWESVAGGLAAQVLHVGPYAAELPTIERMHAFIAEQGCRPVGHHREIYLSDARRTAPDKLRTILRHAVVRISQ